MAEKLYVVSLFDALLFSKKEKANTVQRAKMMCAVNGYSAIAGSILRKWFVRFKSENFDLENRKIFQ